MPAHPHPPILADFVVEDQFRPAARAARIAAAMPCRSVLRGLGASTAIRTAPDGYAIAGPAIAVG